MPAGELTSFADALPARLLELLVIGRMEAAAPGLVGGLVIAGLIHRHDEPGAGGDPARPPFTARRLRLDRLPDLLGSLPDHLRAMYGWGAPGFTGQALLARLADVARHVGLPTLLTTNAGPAQLDLLVGTLTAEPGPLRAELRFGLPAGRTITLPLPQPGWRLTLTAEPALPTGLVARLTPPGTLAVTGAGITGTLRAQLDWTTARPDRPLVVLGEGGGTRLEIAVITAHATARLAAAAGPAAPNRPSSWSWAAPGSCSPSAGPAGCWPRCCRPTCCAPTWTWRSGSPADGCTCAAARDCWPRSRCGRPSVRPSWSRWCSG